MQKLQSDVFEDPEIEKTQVVCTVTDNASNIKYDREAE